MSLKKWLFLSMLTAITVVIGRLFLIPIAAINGLISLLDVGIYLAAYLFGGIGGLFVGAASGLLVDLLAGAPEWMIYSLIIHGLQGYLFGLHVKKNFLFAFLLSSFVMVIGYALATWLLYGQVEATLFSIPANMIQVSIAAVIAYMIEKPIESIMVSRFRL